MRILLVIRYMGIFLLVCFAFLPVHIAQDRMTLPPLPDDLSRGQILFPYAMQRGSITADSEAQFVLLAYAGQTMTIDLQRIDGEFVPYIELRTDRRNPESSIVSQPATDLAGQRARLTYTPEQDGWYFVYAGHDPADKTDATGTFQITSMDVTQDIYALLPYGTLPSLSADERVLLHNRFLLENIFTYYLPVTQGGQFSLQVSPFYQATLYDLDANLIIETTNSLKFQPDQTGWLRLVLQNQIDDTDSVTYSRNETPVVPFNGALGDLITPTPVPTATASPTATPTEPPLDLSQTMIVFTCFINGIDQLCAINGDGSNERQLTQAAATTWYGSLSPSGETILFSSNRTGNFEIYSMNRDGSSAERLTTDINGYAPAMSPDSSQIVFAAQRGNADQDIYIMNRDGSNLRRLTEGNGQDLDPVWSPDGQQILFASERFGQRQLFVMNVNGSNLEALTDSGVSGRSDWSPDGQYIAYYAGARGNEEIFIMNSDGSNIRQLTTGGSNKAPSFSPDGEWIVYASRIDEDGDNELFIMRVDGTDRRKLTSNTRPDYQPRWGK